MAIAAITNTAAYRISQNQSLSSVLGMDTLSSLYGLLFTAAKSSAPVSSDISLSGRILELLKSAEEKLLLVPVVVCCSIPLYKLEWNFKAYVISVFLLSS